MKVRAEIQVSEINVYEFDAPEGITEEGLEELLMEYREDNAPLSSRAFTIDESHIKVIETVFELEYDTGVVEMYAEMADVRKAVLAAHAAGVGIESLTDTDGRIYECTWDVCIDCSIGVDGGKGSL